MRRSIYPTSLDVSFLYPLKNLATLNFGNNNPTAFISDNQNYALEKLNQMHIKMLDISYIPLSTLYEFENIYCSKNDLDRFGFFREVPSFIDLTKKPKI